MSETVVVVPYTPNEKQKVFHSSPADERVYGGAKGGGKSCALVMEALAYGLENPGAISYLFRETYDDLEANLIREWHEKVPPELFSYNASKHIATLVNGTTIYFRYIRNWEDAHSYQGRSMDFIGIDELTSHKEDAVQELLSCLRSPKGFTPKFCATCNPGGVGHTWVKNRYIIPTEYGRKIVKDPITSNTIQFIPATVYDNFVIMDNDPAYVRRLENLPEAQKKAYLYGDWDIFQGQMFEEFNYDIHVVEPFDIPEHWRKWLAVDNGYTDPFAWYWFAVDEQGTVYIYREYTRDYDDPKVHYSDQAKKVVELTGDEHLVMRIAGHDAFNTHPLAEKGKTIISYYQEGGLTGFQRCVTDRILRAATWHEYLKPYYDEVEDKLTSKVKIFNTCKKLIETLPQQQIEENKPDCVAESDIDHWYDAAGYGLIAYHNKYSRKPAREMTPLERHKSMKAKQLKRRGRTF